MGSGDKGFIVYIAGYEHIETEVLWEVIKLSQKRAEVNYIMKYLISTHVHYCWHHTHVRYETMH
jgi:hypothetical protein